MNSSYSALIIDPEGRGRTLLKEALNASVVFKGGSTSPSLEDARTLIERSEGFNVVFLSDRLEVLAIDGFIKSAKQSLKGRDSAYIILLAKDADSATISAGLLKGADGFLLEPYSLDALVEIARLAEKVRAERQSARMKTAMRLLVTELKDQLGRLSKLKKRGHPAGITATVFEEMCSILKELEPETREIYYNTLIDIFTNTKPAFAVTTAERLKRYGGVSRRIQERLSVKALERVKHAFAA